MSNPTAGIPAIVQYEWRNYTFLVHPCGSVTATRAMISFEAPLDRATACPLVEQTIPNAEALRLWQKVRLLATRVSD